MGGKVQEAALDAGVTRQTVTKWKADPEFLAAIEKHRDIVSDEIRGTYVAARVEALEYLRDRLSDPEGEKRDGINAARWILVTAPVDEVDGDAGQKALVLSWVDGLKG